MTNGHVTVNASKRAVCLLTIALIASPLVGAQGGTSASPIKLRLIVPEPQVCLGAAKLEMEAVFSNNSESAIAIFTSSIYDFSFIKTVTWGKRSKVESHEIRKDVGTGDPALHESALVVQPRSTIMVPLEYDIGNPFFSETAIYSVRISYMKIRTTATPLEAVVGNTESNDVLFQINECR